MCLPPHLVNCSFIDLTFFKNTLTQTTTQHVYVAADPVSYMYIFALLCFILIFTNQEANAR